jgi:hypothetical protein
MSSPDEIVIPPAPDRLRTGPANEFIDIAVIVGEQHEALRMLGGRAHVVAQASETEIGAQAVEQRERARLILRDPESVGDLVADMREFGGGEVARQFGRGHLVEAQRVAGFDHVRERDFLATLDRFDGDVVILDQQGQLLGQIFGEDRGLGDANLVFAGRDHAAERAQRGGPIDAALIGEPDLGIGERPVGAAGRIGRRAVGDIRAHRGLQALDGGAVEAVEFGDEVGCDCHRAVLRGRGYGGKTGRMARRTTMPTQAFPSLEGRG